MIVTWDDNSDDSDEEFSSSNKDSSKRVVAFIAFTRNGSGSDSESECEDEESERQRAFNKLFKKKPHFRKLLAQLISENK